MTCNVSTQSEELTMFVPAILPTSALDLVNHLQNANQQRGTEFQQLTQALQSGNLTNARQAFGDLTRSATSSGVQSVQLTEDLSALGSALRSGDLAGACAAYSAIQLGLHHFNPIAAHHHRPHYGGGGLRVLTSGFPDSTGSQREVFRPVNLTA
jgi:hypothetical protein